VRELLVELEKHEPEKAHALSVFHEALVSKRLLSTLRELRTFAADNGLKETGATRREEVITSILRELASRPLHDIRSMLDRVRMESTGGDRSLQGWANIILNALPLFQGVGWTGRE
jgi:hypothetical protein